MDNEFWLQRWQEGQTGFHQQRVLPLLQKHWSSLQLARGSKVLVPLAGKSLDMIWLAQLGHAVFGIELSPVAVGQFFSENKLQPEIRESALGRHHRVGGLELLCGDIFHIDADAVRDVAAVYDRAALIALPEDLRQRYVDHVYTLLPPGTQMLLVTLEYPQRQMAGPPFSVDETQVRQLVEPRWQVTLLERREMLDAEPRFRARGVQQLHTAVYRLQRS